MVDLRPYLKAREQIAQPTPAPANDDCVRPIHPAWLKPSPIVGSVSPMLPERWAVLHRLGFALFPLQPGGKQPASGLATHGCKDATRETVRLLAWADDPALNIGIATGQSSGVFVLDLDSAEAGAEAASRGLPLTLAVATPRGRHLYFRHPGGAVRNRAGIFPGADIRGDGGYVVAPGSHFVPSVAEREAGKLEGFYAFETPPDATAIADAPEWLLDLSRSPQPTARLPSGHASGDRVEAWAKAALASELSALRTAPNGTRNAALNTAAHNLGQIAGGGCLAPDDTLSQLRGAAKDIGLDPNEIEATLASGWGAGLAKPRNSPVSKPVSDTSSAPPAFQSLDMGVIAPNRALPPPFPLVLLPPPWAGWCASEAEQAGAPVDYVALSLLTIAASLIGNARRISPWQGWIEPCILWGMIVGAPSAGKTPGTKPALALVQPIDHARSEAFLSVLKAWREADAKAKLVREVWEKKVKDAVRAGQPGPPMPPDATAPPKPVCPATVFNDSTPEMLALLARAMPKGLLLYRDELAGWLCDFGRYGGDGERQLWLEAYNGAPRRIDRVKHDEPVLIAHFSVAVLGGIQPARFTEAIGQDTDDGLAARFLFAFPEEVAPTRPKPNIQLTWPQDATCRLSALPMDSSGFEGAPVVRRLTEQAAARFHEWRLVHARERVEGMAQGAWGKMPGQLLRVALTVTLLGWSVTPHAPEPEWIDLPTIEAAIGFIDNYAKPMTLRVFGEAATPADLRATTALARWIVAKRPGRFNARQVRNEAGCPSLLREAAQMNAACAGLVDAGWLRPEGERADGGKGRAPLNFMVNPDLWAALAATAAPEPR